MATPAPISVKKSAPTQMGETFGFSFGGGWRVTRLDLLFGMESDVIRAEIS